MATDTDIHRAAAAVADCDLLLLAAGAGMGVDSGLPDFRGPAGFWNAYPEYEKIGIDFYAAADPVHFAEDPAFGWGFYGHRLRLYRDTEPHAGFALPQRWAADHGCELAVVTSNVDGHFGSAGYAADVWEVHGSIHHLQCALPCSRQIWDNTEDVPVDLETMRAQLVPHCPNCGGTARPNILMFGDSQWLSARTDDQQRRVGNLLRGTAPDRVAVVEVGAGTAVPTIRRMSEDLARRGATLVRINPRDSEVPTGQIGIASTGLATLQAIDGALADTRRHT
jgi:NAD-dependent SIR2 family protein deacetylase